MNDIDYIAAEDLIRDELPEFYKCCHDKSADTITMTSAAFGRGEACLLGIAIKYANSVGKTVMIIPANESKE